MCIPNFISFLVYFSQTNWYSTSIFFLHSWINWISGHVVRPCIITKQHPWSLHVNYSSCNIVSFLRFISLQKNCIIQPIYRKLLITHHHLASGNCLYMRNCLVAWHSKRQTSTSLYTAEAQYKVYGSSCFQLLWMKQIQMD